MIQKDKSPGSVYDLLHRQYVSTNRPVDVENILKTKFANNPTGATYRLQLTDALIAQGKRTEAEQVVQLILNERLAQRALQKAPGHPVLTDTLGWVYLKKGLKDSALQTFSNLVRQQRQNPTFRYHLGMAFLEMGDKNKA